MQILMTRPRSISDEDLLDRALTLILRDGLAAVTFASVSTATGLAAATLVQRFGSKRAMLRAALLRGWDLLDARTAACDAAAPDTPAGAVAMLTALSAAYGEGEAGAEGMLVLREDMGDPDLRRRGARWGDVLAEALGRRLVVAANPRLDLGRLMAAQWLGALLWWGVTRDGRPGDAVARSLGAWCIAVGAPLAPGPDAGSAKPAGRGTGAYMLQRPLAGSIASGES